MTQYHEDIIRISWMDLEAFGVMRVMTFQHGLFFSLHFAKGNFTMVCTILREASADMDLQPAYCKLERINNE